MNLILLFNEDFISPKRAVISGRRQEHIAGILKAKQGDRLCVGVRDGKMGVGTIVELGEAVTLDITLDQDPPAPLPVTLIMALPRPPVLKRALICAASLGIKKIILLNFSRVEKSLWQSSALRPEAIRDQLVLGLEQAKDTRMPEVVLQEKFKPFVEDKVPILIKGARALVAHPTEDVTPLPHIAPNQPVTLIIGPEGGIIDYELQLLRTAGVQPLSLGPRILRIESVLPYLVGKL